MSAVFAGDARRLCHRLDDAGLVVGKHDGNERALVLALRLEKHRVQRGCIDHTRLVDGYEADGIRREAPAGEHGRMLDGAGEQEIENLRTPVDSPVRCQHRGVGFGAAAGERGELRLPATSAATAFRASSTSCRAVLPSVCTDDALPGAANASSIAARASGLSGAVAL